jgi:cell division septation protein DedD
MSATQTSKSTTEDTEITLGTGKMLGLFFGLVILCAVFFGMGYTMGKNAVKAAPELLPSPSTTTGTRPAGSKPSGTPAPAPQEVVQQQSVPPGTTASAAPNPAGSTPQSAPTADQPTAQLGAGYFVQVAAVSKQEDAEALVESLKGRQYSAVIGTAPSDKLFHVQVGPLADIKDAEAMRAKLVSDGYTPILKK